MSHSRSFADLLTEYMSRTGIGDAELARRIDVNRLTLIRWREGVTERPRHRDDVVRCADVLRLSSEERDEFILAAGFQPDSAPTAEPDPEPPLETPDSTPIPPTPPTESASIFRSRGLKIGIALVGVAFLLVGFAVVANNLDLVGPDPTPVPPTPVPTLPPTVAPPTPTATPVLPTSTPPPATVARDGESLILVAPFANYTAGAQGYNVSGRLQERIESELTMSGLPNARTFLWPETIRSESEAMSATERSGALLTIWGEYDSGRVLARFTTAPSYAGTGEQRVVDLATSPSELPTTINVSLTGAVRFVVLVTSGRVYLDQGEYDRAKAVLTRAATPPPNDPAVLADIRYLLGTAYLDGQLFDYDESITMFSLVLQEQRLSVEALNGRAVAYLRRDNPEDILLALTDLTRAESIRPDRAETHLNLGVAYMTRAERDDPTRALIAFSNAIQLEPDYAAAYVNRAGAYIARGETTDFDLAFADLQHALSLDSNLYHAYLNRGLAYIARGGSNDVRLAIEEYTLEIALAPETPNPYFHRGLAHSQRGDLSESAADLERAAERDPNNLAYQDAACRQLTIAGDPASALRYCDTAVQGGHAGALYSRTLAYAMLGLPDQAELDLDEFSALANISPSVTCRTAQLEAASMLEAPIATARGEAEIWDLLAFRLRPIIPGRPGC